MTGDMWAELGRNVAIISAILGLVAVAIKVGQWKGEHQIKIEHNHNKLGKIENQQEMMDKRFDRLDRELAGTLTALGKDIEYIKKGFDDLKRSRRKNGTEKHD